MERTELREAFFAETRRDPYAHMVAKLYAQAWADGYDQALRDAERALAPDPRAVIEDMRHSKTFGDRESEAIERVTDKSRKAEAEMLIAMAQVGSLIGGPKRGD